MGKATTVSIVSWLASVLLETSIDSCNEPSENTAETWVADMMRDIRPTIDKIRAGDSRLIDVMGYGALTVAFPANVIVKLLDVAFMVHLSRNRFSLMTAHRRGVGFKTEESGCLLYTSPSPRDGLLSRMPSSA